MTHKDIDNRRDFFVLWGRMESVTTIDTYIYWLREREYDLTGRDNQNNYIDAIRSYCDNGCLDYGLIEVWTPQNHNSHGRSDFSVSYSL